MMLWLPYTMTRCRSCYLHVCIWNKNVQKCSGQLSRSFTWDNFTRTGNTIVLFDVAGIVKPEFCSCGQGHGIAGTMLKNIHRIKLLQILGIPGYTCNHLRLLSQNSFEDVELPVQVKNRRCSHGFKTPSH